MVRGLSLVGLPRAPEREGSAVVVYNMWDLNSLTGDRTCVPCIRRQILNHWAIRGIPHVNFIFCFFPYKILL